MAISLQGESFARLAPKYQSILLLGDSDGNKKLEGNELIKVANTLNRLADVREILPENDTKFVETSKISGYSEYFDKIGNLFNDFNKDTKVKVFGDKVTSQDIADLKNKGVPDALIAILQQSHNTGFYSKQAEDIIKNRLDIKESTPEEVESRPGTIKISPELQNTFNEIQKKVQEDDGITYKENQKEAEKTLLTNVNRGKATADDFKKAGLGNVDKKVIYDINTNNFLSDSITIDSIQKNIIKFTAEEKILRTPLQATSQDYVDLGFNQVTNTNLRQVNNAVEFATSLRGPVDLDIVVPTAIAEAKAETTATTGSTGAVITKANQASRNLVVAIRDFGTAYNKLEDKNISENDKNDALHKATNNLFNAIKEANALADSNTVDKKISEKLKTAAKGAEATFYKSSDRNLTNEEKNKEFLIAQRLAFLIQVEK